MLFEIFKIALVTLLLCGCGIDTPNRWSRHYIKGMTSCVDGGLKWKHAIGSPMETTSTSQSRLKTHMGGLSNRKTVIAEMKTEKSPEPSWNPTPEDFWNAMTPLRLARRFVVLLKNTAYVDLICNSGSKGTWKDDLYYTANANPLVAESLAEELTATFMCPEQLDKSVTGSIMFHLEESCKQRDVLPIASYLWNRLYHYHKEERRYGFSRDIHALSHPEEYIFGGTLGFARIDAVAAITNPGFVWTHDDIRAKISPYARDFSAEMWEDWSKWFGKAKRPVFEKQVVYVSLEGAVYTLQDYVSLLTFVTVSETGFAIPMPTYVRDAIKDGTLVLNLP